MTIQAKTLNKTLEYIVSRQTRTLIFTILMLFNLHFFWVVISFEKGQRVNNTNWIKRDYAILF